MRFIDIKAKVAELHREIWRDQKTLWNGKPSGLITMLEPEIAAQVLRVHFAYYEDLSRFGDRKERFEIAGLIDRQAGRIAVSKKFPSEIARFTGGHELGHWCLHTGEIMLRDRPLKGLSHDKEPRPPLEKEADYFAACFLVPEKLTISIFEKNFGTKPLALNDDSAFWLSNGEPDSLFETEPGSLAFALAVATATSYKGQHFDSLAKQFRVSNTTMAIRLKELQLLDYT